MSNLRERKKTETREAILQSAKRLFIAQGYTKTTMGDIARDCDVGVGTLYNYYISKSVLLTEIFRIDLPDLSDQVDIIKQNNLLDLREKLRSVISLFMDVFHRQFPRFFYRELITVFSSQAEGNTEIFNGLLDIDRQAMGLVTDILQQEKISGRLPAAYPLNTAVDLIYSIIVMQILLYVFDNGLSEEQIKNTILEQIDFLLKYTKQE